MDLPKRKNVRLQGYDYGQNGAYFITVCVKDRHELLGTIAVGAGSTRPSCYLSTYGIIVENHITSISNKYQNIVIDKYVIMPNHIHCIVIIDNNNGRVDPAPTVGRIMGYFKYQTTKDIGIPGFWQRSYHDHIIRNEFEYRMIWQYIDENPQKWQEDRYYG